MSKGQVHWYVMGAAGRLACGRRSNRPWVHARPDLVTCRQCRNGLPGAMAICIVQSLQVMLAAAAGRIPRGWRS